jgi:hypothetical protein
MPDERILVVDSDSPDKTYFATVEAMGAMVAPIANRHYETGALWHAYRAYPEESFFYLMHDSTEVLKDMTHLKNVPVSGFQGLEAWGNTEGFHVQWANDALATTKIPMSHVAFSMLMGCIHFVQHALLDRLVELGFHAVLPINKWQSQSMERLWGLAYAHIGHYPIPMLRPWEWVEGPAGIRSEYMVKYLLHRP